MLDKVVLRRASSDTQGLDAGLIAESLLFYQNVHVIFDQGTLIGFLEKLGPDLLFELFDSGLVTGTFVRDILAVHTRTDHGIQIYDLGFIELAGTQQRRIASKDEHIQEIFERALGKSGNVRHAAKKFTSLVRFKRYGNNDFGSEPVNRAARTELDDPRFCTAAIRSALAKMVPTLAADPRWYCKVVDVSDGFMVDTNINMDVVNHEHRRFHNENLIFSNLLACILEARGDVAIASHYLADVVTSEISSEIMKVRFQTLLESRNNNLRNVEIFQDAVLRNGRAVRQAINSGERSFAEFLDLIQKAKRFKEWLGSGHPDASILENYYDSITRHTWFDKIPGKFSRFVFFTGAGLLADFILSTGFGTGAGVAIGATDTFILDRFLKGWRPNQFIDDHLRDFVSRN